MPNLAHEFGKFCENAAANYYKKCGARILVQNYRCRTGEIDLILADKQTLIFVEVRGRTHDEEAAIISVDRKKRARLAKVAAWFLACEEARIPPEITEVRFDVVAVKGDGSLTRIPHAFFL